MRNIAFNSPDMVLADREMRRLSTRTVGFLPQAATGWGNRMESWVLHSQKTGFRMFHGDTRVGGWDRRNHHLFILDSYVEELPDRAVAREILRRFGFQLREQPPDHFWWRVAEAEFRSFVDALMALARLAPAPSWEESPEPGPGPR